MMRVALSCLLAAPLAAHAQAPMAPTATHDTGPSPAEISNKRGLSDIDRGRLAGAEFARCVARMSPKRVDAVLAMPVMEAYQGPIAKLASDQCLANGKLRFNAGVLRGALFVEMYRQRSAAESQGKAWIRPIAPLDMTNPAAGAAGIPQPPLLRFADCVVRRNPSVARDVVLLPTASAGQEAALKRLRPDLGPCFRGGDTMTLSKAVLEGALAEILYRTPTASLTPAAEEAK